MKLYIDTSALVKFFHEEACTRTVSDLIENTNNMIFISELAKIEFCSALFRRCRNGEITKQNLQRAIAGFEDQIAVFYVERLGSAVIIQAEKLVKQYGLDNGLRTLDALHLATFHLISGSDWYFVSTDKHLNASAVKMGFAVIHPEEVK
ncbi:type II toxin-antitoxin system VapC family toxin [candidate division KSB1 bacterium]|nr:type II toxin-antitoxin system VapC family toxin [candidate division KSB1 bacterium]